MKKLNKKGFTLIELLAVIVIMGILMIVAIPAMSRYMENSRRDTFKTTAQEYANSIRNLWLSDGIACTVSGKTIYSTSLDAGDYYVDINSTGNDGLMESGGKSSWSNLEVKGYVRVNVTTGTSGERTTKYYITLADTKGHGIASTYATGTSAVESSELRRSHVGTDGVAQATVPSGGIKCTIEK